MFVLVSMLGWSVTGLALACVQRRGRRRLALVARAGHELRGPLCAARLALEALAGGDPGRVAAIDLELARAGRALDDLELARTGRTRSDHVERVDLRTLVRAYAPSWRTLAAAHRAGFRLACDDDPDPVPPATAGRRPASPRRTRAISRVGDPPATVIPLRPPRQAPLAHLPSRDRGTAAGSSATVVALRPPRPQPAVVVADPLRLAQAIANVVANAAEHGGGAVRVGVTRAGTRVRVEVADDGPGLPVSIAALKASARGRTGRRGHGLAIAAAIAERYGGHLTALPAARGARIALDLPAAADAQTPLALSARATSAGSRLGLDGELGLRRSRRT
jgi:signal transduction histidine kinase